MWRGEERAGQRQWKARGGPRDDAVSGAKAGPARCAGLAAKSCSSLPAAAPPLACRLPPASTARMPPQLQQLHRLLLLLLYV